MEVTLAKLKKWLPIVLAAAIAMHFITGQVLDSDDSLPAVKDFVLGNARLAEEVGAVDKVEPIKVVKVAEGSEHAAYRLYTLRVRGSRSTAVATVRLEEGVSGSRMALESVEPR